MLEGDNNVAIVSRKMGMASILFMLPLAACGKLDNGAADKAPNAQTPPAEIVFYGGSTQPKDFFDKQYGELLYKKFPQHTFKYIQMPSGNIQEGTTKLLTEGQRIDIFYNNIGIFENTLFSFGMQYDMTDLMKKHQVDLGRLEQESIKAMKQFSGGKTYGVPVTDMKFVLFYNKDIFDKFGVGYPRDGMTWDEAIELGKKLTRFDNGTQYVGLSTSPSQFIAQNQLSIPIVNNETEQPTINTNPGWRRLFDALFVQPMQDNGVRSKIGALKAIPGNDAFVTKQDLAMYAYNIAIYISPSLIPAMQQFNWDMVTVPVFPDAPGVGSQTTPFYFGLTNMTKEKDAAMEVLKFMISDEYQNWVSRRGFIPTLMTDETKREYGKETAFPNKNYAALFKYKNAPIPPSADYTFSVNSVYAASALPIANGTKDMNTAFREAEELALKRIEEAKRNRTAK
ncbi:carbohydrate ABC transporter substrate-binding protein [Paenibacillus mesophilus]|uniref:ABC transporter substrate-binding protein n=1 Tax=Paenibacillus mesophilus TaxID=2582849 RepID=UPI00110E3245|nr:ABC transporter substrate-binding protein [Paenibacillus mesophilus]TMV52264.1 carbohydrate ABC transporter substrate-binding protein [Paenibacillus mesophilus]